MNIGKKETQLAKFILRRIWEGYAGAVMLLAILLWLDNKSGSKYIGASPILVWSVLASLAIIFTWLCQRLYRRAQRRHSCKQKGLFHGWWFRYDYHRIELLGGDMCHFDCFCLECRVSYPVKAPVLKSFEHRPAWLYFW